jgi:hypothetical protein
MNVSFYLGFLLTTRCDLLLFTFYPGFSLTAGCELSSLSIIYESGSSCADVKMQIFLTCL